MKKITTLCLVSFASIAFSQEKDTLANKLNEVKIESQRYTKSSRVASQHIESINQKEIEFGNFQTTAEMLANSGKLFVQKSQQGGGSPVIRGFESSRILLLVDGVRMNNLIYRGGHLQNVITVDENMLESTDILFGASSTAYGSDAMGGAINLITKRALTLEENKNKFFSGNFNTRYGSVNKEKSGYLDFRFSGKKWGTFTALSYNDFEDLKMGKNRLNNTNFFGSRPFYVSTNNGVDEIKENPDPYLQKFSGYKQYNATQKFVFKPNSTTSHDINLQFSTTNDIPRYDRLTDLRNGNLRFATWNYGPQKRILGGYKFSRSKAIFNSDLTLGANYQSVEESRIQRNRNNPVEQNRIEKVNVYSINLDLKAKIGKGQLLYGVESFYDDLNSTAFSRNIITNAQGSLDTRYPNGKNYNLKADAFVTYFAKYNETTTYNLGARGGYNKLYSEFKDKSFFPFPYSTIEQKNFTYSVAAGLTKQSTDNIKIAFNIASGFRTPNVDDLAKVFESSSGNTTTTGILIVPNPNIKPEKNITGDFNFNLNDKKHIDFDQTVYYTRLFDVIALDNFTFNGQNIINYGGFPATVKANQNLNSGTIFGYSASLKVTILSDLKFYGNYNFTYGRVKEENTKIERPLDHIPPHYGKVGFTYENKWMNLDFNMLYNGKKNLKDYSSSGEDNLQYATASGMPAWQTLNFKSAFKPLEKVTFFAGVENILDVQYRVFASGINAPGRNIYGGLKYSI